MTGFAEGFLFGLGSSLHCAAMCGPLALATAGTRRAAASYHATRGIGYIAAGAVLGAAGGQVQLGGLRAGGPWLGLLMATLLLFALGGLGGVVRTLLARTGCRPGAALTNRLHRGAAQVVGAALSRTRRWSPNARIAVLGALTPLLPCGVSWLLYGTSMLAGSALDGAQAALGFVCGSAPLLLCAQLQAGWWRTHVSPAMSLLVLRLMVWTAAAVLAWRSVVALRGDSCCA
jgi:hypothetical protein